MKQEVIDLLVCPACAAGSLRAHAFQRNESWGITDGVLCCPGCGEWYPIEDGVLELLKGPLAYGLDRERFWRAHEAELQQLSLKPWVRRGDESDVKGELEQQAHFDWYADNPAQTYSAYELTPFWQAEDALIFDEWRRVIRPGARLLDLGCAQGRSSFKLLDLDLEIVGIDVSKRLIREAVKRYRSQSAVARGTFFVADGQRLPFTPSSFDCVLIYGVLHHLSDPAAACAEAARVLKPGGLYLGSENNDTFLRWAFELLQRLMPLWHEEAGTHPLIGRRQLEKWLGEWMSELSMRTSVFLPPHLFGRLSVESSRRLLRITDKCSNRLPVLKNQGGLIVARGVRR